MNCQKRKVVMLAAILMIVIGCGNKKTHLLLANGEQYAARWDYTEDDDLTEPRTAYCDTIISPDERLALITWNTGEGGVSPDIHNMVVWRDSNGDVYRRECSVRGVTDGFNEKVEGCYVFGIDTINCWGGFTYYLVTSMHREASWSLGHIMIEAWAIEGKRILSCDLFDISGDSEVCSKIEFEYNILDWALTGMYGDEWHGPIQVQPNDKTILIPHITLDSVLCPAFTDTFTVYKRDSLNVFYVEQPEPFILKTER